jgi:hypothetical protein
MAWWSTQVTYNCPPLPHHHTKEKTKRTDLPFPTEKKKKSQQNDG